MTYLHQLRQDIPSLIQNALAKLKIPAQSDTHKEPPGKAQQDSDKHISIILSNLVTSVNSSLASIERMVTDSKAMDMTAQLSASLEELSKQLSTQHMQTDTTLDDISNTVSKVLGHVLDERKRRKLAEHNHERRRQIRAAVLEDAGTISQNVIALADPQMIDL